jgi:hypothetical protein
MFNKKVLIPTLSREMRDANASKFIKILHIFAREYIKQEIRLYDF